ncbi:lysozyme [Flavobacterium aquaticum]|uniref:Lysozyme n=1 Tax=Flavobacterium aquaticum TaxID=1236486 RepID=A0A327YKR9_9FLAO|nr:lysozyme [Flavobacterium aquaticum]RAK21624.1 lysozyme [Flavobacterium aquaticum]
MKITSINEEGLKLIMKYEGFSATPYLCPAGVPTIGYGTTRYSDGTKVTMKDEAITKEQAIEILKEQVKNYELAVDAMTTDKVNQNQFNALVSFAYNLGVNALKKSNLLRVINLNIWDGKIEREFNKWVYANGRVLKGLQKRRNDESKMYFKK